MNLAAQQFGHQERRDWPAIITTAAAIVDEYTTPRRCASCSISSSPGGDPRRSGLSYSIDWRGDADLVL
jgi:hypothetical protein